MGRISNEDLAGYAMRDGNLREAQWHMGSSVYKRKQQAEDEILRNQWETYTMEKEANRRKAIARRVEALLAHAEDLDLQGQANWWSRDQLQEKLEQRYSNPNWTVDLAAQDMGTELRRIKRRHPSLKSKKDADLPDDTSVPAALIISLNLIREIEKQITKKLKETSP